MSSLSQAVALNTGIEDVFLRSKDFKSSDLNNCKLIASDGAIVNNYADHWFQYYFDEKYIIYTMNALFKYFYDEITFDEAFEVAERGFHYYVTNNPSKVIVDIATECDHVISFLDEEYGKTLLDAELETAEYDFLMEFVGNCLFFSQFIDCVGISLNSANIKYDCFDKSKDNKLVRGKFMCDVIGIIDCLQKLFNFGLIMKYGNICSSNEPLPAISKTITTGNIDFCTFDTLWLSVYEKPVSGFKPRKDEFSNQSINELLVTYLMCKDFDWYSELQYIGIFNMYNGKSYRYRIDELPFDALQTLRTKVIYKDVALNHSKERMY